MREIPEAFVFDLDGDSSDGDYLGVSKTITATGAAYKVQGPLAKAFARALMEAEARGMEKERERCATLVEDLGAIIDHPSVYMGGPSREAKRKVSLIAKTIREETHPLCSKTTNFTARIEALETANAKLMSALREILKAEEDALAEGDRIGIRWAGNEPAIQRIFAAREAIATAIRAGGKT